MITSNALVAEDIADAMLCLVFCCLESRCGVWPTGSVGIIGSALVQRVVSFTSAELA